MQRNWSIPQTGKKRFRHDFLSNQPDDGSDRFSHGYPEECRDFALFADSLAALVYDEEWLIQPFTQKRAAILVDFVSERETEAEASVPHGWNGAYELPMGSVNTVHSRTETNEQNALIGRHLCLIATGETMRDFHVNVVEKLLDGHSCKDRNCRICGHRCPRDLALVFALFADGMKLKVISLFSKWEPSQTLRASLQADGIAIEWHPLHDIPEDDLEANRYYSIWDGPKPQSDDFLRTFWSPSWQNHQSARSALAEPSEARYERDVLSDD